MSLFIYFRIKWPRRLLFAALLSCRCLGAGEIKPDIAAEIRNCGNSSDRFIAGCVVLLENDSLGAYVNEVLGRLQKSLKERSPEFVALGAVQVLIVNDPHINAFSTGGQLLFVTTGLLNELHSEDELAGVLAHELAHTYFQHPYKTMRAAQAAQTRSQFYTTLFVIAVAGPSIGAGASSAAAVGSATPAAFQAIVPAQQASIMLQSMSQATMAAGSAVSSGNICEQELVLKTMKGFREDEETSADQLAIQLLKQGGFQPAEYVELLRRLQVASVAQKNQYYSKLIYALPGLTKRISEIERQATQ